MEESRKLKNIYDLRHNQLLNHQNVWLVLLGTLIITFWFQNFGLGFQKAFFVKIFVTFVTLLILFLVIRYYNDKIRDVEIGIDNL